MPPMIRDCGAMLDVPAQEALAASTPFFQISAPVVPLRGEDKTEPNQPVHLRAARHL